MVVDEAAAAAAVVAVERQRIGLETVDRERRRVGVGGLRDGIGVCGKVALFVVLECKGAEWSSRGLPRGQFAHA